MNSQTQTQEMIINSLDAELIFDTKHLLMNYLKFNSFNEKCFTDTTIQVSPEIKNLPPQSTQSSTAFASKYFTLLASQENAIDIISPIISNFPNSELGLFLSILLEKHLINFAQSLDNTKEIFEKYKNYLLNIYHSILQGNKKQKLLESICSSITILIIIGINGNWTNGLEQLIDAARSSNENNLGNILMTSLIISNINDIFEKLKEKISVQKEETIRAYIKGYSNIIKEFVTFLIKVAFNGPKENFVNTQLFKAFIGIILSLKYFDINIIKIHGFLDFLINCISFMDINQELINQICNIFDYTFSDKNNFGLYFEGKAKFKMNYFIDFLNTVTNHNDFPEIKKCLELIMNVKNYYSNKNIKEINNNPKDIQILFSSCNIFSSLCENFSYLFFLPEIDLVVQDIYYYFISLPIYSISQILLNSFKQIMQYVHFGYNFDNFQENEKITKKDNFKVFLYKIHNSVFLNMKLSNLDDYNNIVFNNENMKSMPRWDKYISELLKEGINDDEKINYIIASSEFYENIYEIINDLYGIKDFCDKMCKYLMSSINNNNEYDLLTIDCIFTVFNKISILLMNTLPESIFNIIDFILTGNNRENIALLKQKRFALQFILLLYKTMTLISKKEKYIYLLTVKFLEQNYEEDKMNLIVINFLYKLIVTSYQTHKNNSVKDNKDISDEDKNYLKDVFNIISQKLLGNMAQMSDNYLLKLIDSLFTSCFFNIFIGSFSNDVMFNIAEKFFKDGNEIFNMAKFGENVNVKELYIKYIYILFSIIKNIGNENSSYLCELLNKIDPYQNNNNITYFSNMENNINVIICDCSSKGKNSDSNIINSIILLYNSILKHLKEKTCLFIDIFQNIINNIFNNNPENIKIFELTVSLYKNVFKYCNTSTQYFVFVNNCFDMINIMNSKYEYCQKDEDKIFLSTKLCEFISLYIPLLSNVICQICDKENKNNSVFSFAFNELIDTFENNDIEEYNNIFSLLIKMMCENDLILNKYIKDYIIRLTTAIISHLEHFKSECNKSTPNYFIILKKFLICDRETFLNSLKRCFNNDQQIIFVISKYLDFVQFENYDKLEIMIKNYNKSFIKELGELQYALDKKKVEFVSKYLKIVDEMGKRNVSGIDCGNNSSEVNKYNISIIRK